MKKLRETQITLGTALALCLMACAAGIACCYAAFGWRTQAVQNKLREIDAIAAEHYVGAFDAETVADYAAVGYITGLGDQWSGYIPADQYESYQMNTEGKGCGIGVSVVTSGQGIRISLVYDASPAQQVGIRLLGGVQGGADEAVGAFLAGSLQYDPDVRCSHHEHHGEGHDCASHGGHTCGGHCHG